ncbi:MAG TPA: 3'-5' exonuclease [Cyclobacteriaceae bacterium]|nr:3'-5' exonuclease [Cyclobacteriaceae bacterium]
MSELRNGFSITNITLDEINALPLKTFKGKVHLIEQPEAVTDVLNHLRKEEVVGFDTETRPSFKKGQLFKVALLQIAVPDNVFLIRLQHTGVTEEIKDFLENDNLIKTGIGIRDDILALQRVKRFQPQGFVDLAPLAKEAGLQVESVKKLTGLLLGFRISKSAQTSNWEASKLTKKQIEYAATDAWVCLELYRKLIR